MKLIESKSTAWCGLILTVILIVLTALSRSPWWGYIAEFFLFISMFSHIASLYTRKMSPPASRQLDLVALVCIVLAVLGLIAEYIVANVDFGL